MAMYPSGDFRVENMPGGGYVVIAPNGHSYAFESFHAARKMVEANNMGYRSKMQYATKEAEVYPDESVTIDDNGDIYAPKQTEPLPTKQYSTEPLEKLRQEVKRLQEIVKHEDYQRRATPTQKIEDEIARIEAQIAKSNDPENKAKMTTYVAGLHKALKLIK